LEEFEGIKGMKNEEEIFLLNPQLQLSEETWHLWGVISICQNSRNKKAPKWLEAPLWATCPFSNVTRH